MTAFYLPYEFTSTLIPTGNVNPFGVDPEQTVPITGANTDPFGVDPERTTLMPTSNTDPFDIDPEQTTLITVGLTAHD